MTDKTRIRIAAIITALFLAGISAAGLAAQRDKPQAAAASAAAPAAVQTDTAANTISAAPAAQSSTPGEGYDEEREDDD